jgi:hypothetical protein
LEAEGKGSERKLGSLAKESSDAGVDGTPCHHDPTLAVGKSKENLLVLEDSGGNTMPLSNPSGGSNHPAPRLYGTMLPTKFSESRESASMLNKTLRDTAR